MGVHSNDDKKQNLKNEKNIFYGRLFLHRINLQIASMAVRRKDIEKT